MYYRTRTYIAADWTGDRDAVDQIYKWNDSNYWSLSFTDAHELTQARDASLNCSIKRSLKERLDASKTFVLIVGNNTTTLTAGSCRYCNSYNSWTSSCARGNSIDRRSFIEYECEKALAADIKIVVLYNSTYINKSKCPEILRYKGNHASMVYRGSDGSLYWDYDTVKNAIMR